MDEKGNLPTACTERNLKTELSMNIELDIRPQLNTTLLYCFVQPNTCSHVTRRAVILSTRHSTAHFSCSFCIHTANLALISSNQGLYVRLWYAALCAPRSRVSSASSCKSGRTKSLLNCFFGLAAYLTWNTATR
jgi:hypothetical protein